MKLDDILEEVFNKPVPFTKRTGRYGAVYDFTIGDIEYMVNFKLLTEFVGDVVSTAVIREFPHMKTKELKDIWVFDFEGGGSWEILETGNSVAVMSTVVNILKDAVKTPNAAKYLYFTASGMSRRKLYERIIKRFNKKYWQSGSGYIVEL